MSFSLPGIELIKQILGTIGPRDEPIKLLSLGYPDLLLRTEDVVNVFGQDVADKLVYREDSARIIAWHSQQGKLDRIIDADSLFKLINIELHSIDIVADRGCERIVDLNDPLPDDMRGAYDIVVDGGTTEHCFNIGQAMKNVAEMAKVGGFIIQANGLNNYNHGFFGINPTCYYDLYGQNHFDLRFFMGFTRRKSPIYPEMFELPTIQSFHSIPELSGVMVVARRTSPEPIKWPMQSKYLQSRKKEAA